MRSAKSYINNKFFIILLIACAAALGTMQLAQWKKRSAIAKEVALLTSEAQSLEQKNAEISSSLEFLHTNSAKERIARQQLNMKKDGEIVVNFAESTKAESTQAADAREERNVEKWWKYFFGN